MSIQAHVQAKNLTEMERHQYDELALQFAQPKYRAGQLYEWVFQKYARSFDEMTNLPKPFKQKLIDEGYQIGRAEIKQIQSSVDGTKKLAIQLKDGGVIETVLIPMGDGSKYTQCLSSQLGCAINCQFCYTATLGLSRNLSAGEIIDQVLLAKRFVPEINVSNLVYMGMGEPLHNLEQVINSLKVICDEQALGYSYRRVTISTSGLVPQIEKLAQLAPVNLAFSMNATTDEVRNQVMPINKRYPIAKVIEALKKYPLPPRRKLTIEYVLLGGLNDSKEDAIRLTRWLQGMNVRINLIPWNPFQGPKYQRPAEENVLFFQQLLMSKGFNVTVRGTKGIDIDAACGQLGERPDMGPQDSSPAQHALDIRSDLEKHGIDPNLIMIAEPRA
jgi:23S rRNA (adenine2503-C2)-methyltransferase